MADSFTEVTSESWFSRIGGAIKGVFSGIVLCFAAVVLLFWNEGRAVTSVKLSAMENSLGWLWCKTRLCSLYPPAPLANG
jgi:hypothetical protein